MTAAAGPAQWAREVLAAGSDALERGCDAAGALTAMRGAELEKGWGWPVAGRVLYEMTEAAGADTGGGVRAAIDGWFGGLSPVEARLAIAEAAAKIEDFAARSGWAR